MAVATKKELEDAIVIYFLAVMSLVGEKGSVEMQKESKRAISLFATIQEEKKDKLLENALMAIESIKQVDKARQN